MAVKKDQEFKVRIAIDIDKATEKELQKAGISTERLGRELKVAQKAVHTFGSSFARMGVIVTSVNQGLELSRRAYQALIGPIKSSVSAFLEQEKAESKLINTLRVTGQYTRQTRKEFFEFARAMQQTTTVSDEVALGLMAQAKAMGLSDDMTRLLVKTSADLASVTRTDVTTAYEQLIRTFSGSTGRLSMLIPELKGLSAAQLKAGEGIRLLAKRFGGFAEIEAQTMQGSLKQLSNLFGDLKEEIGKTVVEVFDLPRIINFLKNVFKTLIEVIRTLRINLVFFAETLRQIDFEKARNGVIALTVAVSGFFLAVNVGTLTSFASAVISMAKAFIAATVAGLKFTLIAAAIAAAAAAVDILIANMKDLSALKETIAGGFMALFLRIQRGFQGVALILSTGIFRIVEALYSLGLASDQALQRAQQSLTYFSDQIDSTNQQIEYTQNALSEVAKKVDLGFSGEIIKTFKTLLSGANKEMLKSEDNLGNLGAAQKAINLMTEQQRQTLVAIQAENAALELQIKNIGATQIEVLRNQLAFEKERLQVRIEQLKLEDKFNSEIEAALNRQVALMENLAQKREVEIAISEVGQPAQVMAKGAQFILEAFKEGTGLLSDGFIASAVIATAKISDGLFRAGSFVADALIKLFDPSFWEGIVTMLGETLARLPEMLVKVLEKLGDILAEFIERFPKAFAALVDRLPEIFERIGELLPGLARVLMDALVKLFENLPEILQPLIDAIPLVLEEIFKKMPALIKAVFLAIGDIFKSLVDIIPDVMVVVMEYIPDMIEAFIVGLSGMMDRIVMAFVEFFISGGVEKIVKAFIRMIPRIVVAIARGLLAAIKNSIDYFFGKQIKMPKELTDFPTNISNAAKEFVTTGMDEASKLFSVKEFVDPIQNIKIPTLEEIEHNMMAAAEKAGRTIWESFVKALSNAWEFIKGIGRWIWEGLLGAINLFVDAIKGIGQTIWQGLEFAFKTSLNIFKNAGNFIWQGLKSALSELPKYLLGLLDKISPSNLLEKMFPKPEKSQGTVERIIARVPGFDDFDLPYVRFARGGIVPGEAPIRGDSPINDRVLAYLSPGEAVIPRSLMQNPAIAQQIAQILDRGNIPGYSLGKSVSKGLERVGKVVSDPIGAVKDVLETLTDPIGKFVEQIKAQMGRMFEGAISQGLGGFAEGGLVYAQSGGFVARGTDTVPAMLSPGEFIVNAKSARANLGLLTSINEGHQSGGGVVIEKIEINAQTNLTPDSIRREVLPAIITGLKRKSQDGEFIMSARGIR